MASQRAPQGPVHVQGSTNDDILEINSLRPELPADIHSLNVIDGSASNVNIVQLALVFVPVFQPIFETVALTPVQTAIVLAASTLACMALLVWGEANFLLGLCRYQLREFAAASDTPRIAFAPSRPLLGVPSSSSSRTAQRGCVWPR